MILTIGQFLASEPGTLQDLLFSHTYNFEDDLYKTIGEVEFKGKLYKDIDSIIVICDEFSVECQLPCEYCDKSHIIHFKTPRAFERVFYKEIPEEHKDEEIQDFFLIDLHKHRIDLTEMVKQEIELHLPLNHACPVNDKGICEKCGKNINDSLSTSPGEKAPEVGTQNPFANLKNLLEGDKE